MCKKKAGECAEWGGGNCNALLCLRGGGHHWSAAKVHGGGVRQGRCHIDNARNVALLLLLAVAGERRRAQTAGLSLVARGVGPGVVVGAASHLELLDDQRQAALLVVVRADIAVALLRPATARP